MISYPEIILRLITAALLGCVIGLERERLSWVAGMRTHMLVCLGSALIMMVSMFGFSDILGHPDVVLDPSRVAAQVVSGIGFLGAGTIFFWRKEVIRGLTTAAGLWAVAGIGLAIGGGMYVAGGAATILVLIILALLKPVEKIMFRAAEKSEHIILIRAHRDKMDISAINEELLNKSIKVIEIKSFPYKGKDKDTAPLIDISITGEGEKMIDFVNEMSKNPGIESVTYS